MSAPPTPDGLFETHLTVADLDRSIAFYRDVVGLRLALHDPELGAAFFWIGDAGAAMLGLWSAGPAPLGISLHLAFRTSLENVLGAGERLREIGVTPLSFSGQETGEPSVIGWMPAAAIYFRDPDGHLLEYLAMLDDRPDPERRIIGWSEWTAERSRPRVLEPAGPVGLLAAAPRPPSHRSNRAAPAAVPRKITNPRREP